MLDFEKGKVTLKSKYNDKRVLRLKNIKFIRLPNS